MPIRIKNSASIDPVVGLGTRIGNKPVTINEVMFIRMRLFQALQLQEEWLR